MSTQAAGARRVSIEALSARSELLLVVRASMAILVGVWIYVAAVVATGGGAATGPRNLLPFQQLMANRPPEEQRIFRELQEGLLEAEASRSAAGAWPATASLAADGIPPFAIDPTRRSEYRWTLVQSGTIVNYLGTPVDSRQPAWLILIQEPVPGVPPDQTFEDEEHHRLANGEMLHVSTWVHAAGRAVAQTVVRMPQAEGWTQLYAVGPAKSTSPNLSAP